MVSVSASLDPWTAWPRELKEALHQNQLVAIPNQELWKLEYLRSLLSQLQVVKQVAQEDRIKYIQGLIDSLVL